MQPYRQLLKEDSRTIAWVVVYAPTGIGAEILGALTAARRFEVVRTVLEFDPFAREDEDELFDGVDVITGILESLTPEIGRAVVHHLALTAPALAHKVRSRMVVFEDLCKLADQDVQALLKNTDRSQWAVALLTASEELKNRIFTNMSSRSEKMLKEEMVYMGKMDVAEIEKVQRDIAYILRRLKTAGEITTDST